MISTAWFVLAGLVLAGMIWDWHRESPPLLSSVVVAAIIAAVALWPVRMYCRLRACIVD